MLEVLVHIRDYFVNQQRYAFLWQKSEARQWLDQISVWYSELALVPCFANPREIFIRLFPACCRALKFFSFLFSHLCSRLMLQLVVVTLVPSSFCKIACFIVLLPKPKKMKPIHNYNHSYYCDIVKITYSSSRCSTLVKEDIQPWQGWSATIPSHFKRMSLNKYLNISPLYKIESPPFIKEHKEFFILLFLTLERPCSSEKQHFTIFQKETRQHQNPLISRTRNIWKLLRKWKIMIDNYDLGSFSVFTQIHYQSIYPFIHPSSIH